MSRLVEKIHEDIKEAMRSGDPLRRDTLRFLESAIKNAAIGKRAPLSEFSDTDAQAVIRRSVKEREESALQYRVGGRADLAEKEEKERAILAVYLPPAPDEKKVREAIERAVSETNASSMSDMGKIMGIVMKEFPNASGNEVRRIVEEILKSH